MKFHLAVASLSIALIGCSTLNQPISGEGNPLDNPLDAGKKESFSHKKSSSSYESSQGQFPLGTTVETSSSNAELYEKVPSFGLWAKKSTLPAGTEGRVIDYNQGYAYLELEDGIRGYIKSQYLTELIIDEPEPTNSQSDSIITNQDDTIPDLPDPSQLGSTNDEALPTSTSGQSEGLYELSDEEIIKKIQERKEALIKQREAEQSPINPPAQLPEPTPSVEAPELPSPEIEKAVIEAIDVPALDSPKAEIDAPGLE